MTQETETSGGEMVYGDFGTINCCVLRSVS